MKTMTGARFGRTWVLHVVANGKAIGTGASPNFARAFALALDAAGRPASVTLDGAILKAITLEEVSK